MKKLKVKTTSKKILADTITPVSIYLKMRDNFPNTILLESSDYHGAKDINSFICMQPIASFTVDDNTMTTEYPGSKPEKTNVNNNNNVSDALNEFLKSFEIVENDSPIKANGIFGYTTFDAIQYFETIKLNSPVNPDEKIPDLKYSFYKYIIAINHSNNNLVIHENLLEGEKSSVSKLEALLNNRNIANFNFEPTDKEETNLTDEEYMKMVTKGKEHCFRGDVFQIVLSRQFSQKFKGDDFNVYRALRSINPSPYLFYFDYGSFKIFGSSPEAQLQIEKDRAYIHPIAGTFKRTGDDVKDKQSAIELSNDPKENAEHVMLVDLARNDLSRNGEDVVVETYKEIQYFSHVLHMVSIVSGQLTDNTNIIKVMGDTFPAGTLSGAPKYKAMELIDKYENKKRGYYGGAIGYITLDGNFNHAIMIRTFLSKNNTLFYQAGAGIVSKSVEESEKDEVNNKLRALKTAINSAKSI